MNRTRQKILDTALELFNEKGSSEVSTNHICEKAGISPGNLYYHFRGKDEIIVEIFQSMIARWDDSPLPSEGDPRDLLPVFERILEFLWQYRFIHREISALYHRLPSFREIFQSAQVRRMKEIHNFIRLYAKTGALRKMTLQEERQLVRQFWFFSLYWLAYLETEGRTVTQATFRESIGILKSIIQPYLKEAP